LASAYLIVESAAGRSGLVYGRIKKMKKMKRLENIPYRSGFLILAIICLCGMSIDGEQSEGETIYGSINHDDMEREYILYIPESYTGDVAVPLVLNFHGYTSTAFEQMNYGDFRPIADTEGFLVAHPQGTLFNGNTHWNVGGWTSGSTVDDVGFTDALIDHLANEYTVDLTRVYSTGMSNGGYMSFHLACRLSEKIAAIASVTGSMTPETYDDCIPLHPSPIMQIHGISDGSVPYEGTSWSKSIDEVLQYWVDYNGCYPDPTTTALPDIDPDDGSTVEYIVYDGGDNGVTVEHFKVIGGGHTWPRPRALRSAIGEAQTMISMPRLKYGSSFPGTISMDSSPWILVSILPFHRATFSPEMISPSQH